MGKTIEINKIITKVAQIEDPTQTEDRVIKIFVDDRLEPFYALESKLRSASDWFVAAFRNEHLGPDEPGILRFPEDGVAGWQLILCWIALQEIPRYFRYPLKDQEEDVQMALVEAWILGQKYFMKGFQDAVMITLIWMLDPSIYRDAELEDSVIEYIFQETDGPLRMLAAEEAIGKIYASRVSPEEHQAALSRLDTLVDQVPGAAGELVQATRRVINHNQVFRIRMIRVSFWNAYMVGDGTRLELRIPYFSEAKYPILGLGQ